MNEVSGDDLPKDADEHLDSFLKHKERDLADREASFDDQELRLWELHNRTIAHLADLQEMHARNSALLYVDPHFSPAARTWNRKAIKILHTAEIGTDERN